MQAREPQKGGLPHCLTGVDICIFGLVFFAFFEFYSGIGLSSTGMRLGLVQVTLFV